MTWTDLGLSTLFLACVTMVPGYATARLFKLPVLVSLGASPALGLGLAAILAHVFPILGIAWGPFSWGVCALIIIGICAVANWKRGILRPHRGTTLLRQHAVAIIAGTVIAAIIQGWGFLRALVVPNAVHVGWDGIYHLSGVQAVIETGDASVWAMSRMYQDGEGIFYPTGFHSLASLVPWLHADAAINAVILYATCIALPIGIAVLATQSFKNFPAVAFVAPIMSVWFLSLTGVLFGYRSALPSGLAAALLPAALCLVWTTIFPRFKAVLLLPVALGLLGVGYAQPAVVVAACLISIPAVLVGLRRPFIRTVRQGKPGKALTIGFLVGFALPLIGAILNHPRVQAVASYPRAPHGDNNWDRLEWALTDESVLFGPGYESWIVLMFTVIGAVFALATRRSFAVTGGWIVTLTLIIGAMSVDWWGSVFTGFFYNDHPRLGALLPATMSILAAAGIVLMATAFYRIFLKVRIPQLLSTVLAFALILVALAVVSDKTGKLREEQRIASLEFKYFTPHSGTMNTVVETWEEIEFIRQTASELPEGSVVIGNPLGGASFFYALGGVDAYPKAINTYRTGTDETYLIQNFHDYLDDPAVCEAVGSLGATHVYLKPESYAEGLTSSSGRPGFFGVPLDGLTPVAMLNDHTGLWRIDACQ